MHDLWHLLILDRAAVADGDWWRLFTGHLIHYGWQHLFYNCLACLAAWLLTPSERRQQLIVLMPLAALLVSAGLLLLAPDMNRYGGASALANAWCYWAALHGRFPVDGKADLPAWLTTALLVGMPLKIVGEWIFASSLLPYHAATFVPMHLAHALGLLAATLFFVLESVRAPLADLGRAWNSRIMRREKRPV